MDVREGLEATSPLGRDSVLTRRRLRAGVLLACLVGALEARAAAPAPGPFPVRMVKLGGPFTDRGVQAHVEFAASIGFNAFWVYGHQAGRWTARSAPEGPRLDPTFLELARWCRERGIRLMVSVNPVAESGGTFVFSERDGRERIRKFLRLLRREAGVKDFVLSFDDQPRRLFELRDIVAYGRGAAPAHLDLARRVLRAGRGGTVWLCSAAYADWHLDEYERYAEDLLEGMRRLPRRIGIVWTGPSVVSESIERADLAAVRERFGGRRLLLYDNYPVNDDDDRDALALILGPLRKRDPGIRDEAAVYLACPMTQLGASRLPLLTIADYLRDPLGYDPDASWKRAIARLAGDDPAALDALKTQSLEWGGWVDTLNYHPAEAMNPATAARDLRDPAAVAFWGWTERRYPERMAALGGLADSVFRDDLLEVMARRLAVSRALPIVAELHSLGRTGAAGAGRTGLERLRRERERTAAEHPLAVRALDRFLAAAGVPIAEVDIEGGRAPATGRAP